MQLLLKEKNSYRSSATDNLETAETAEGSERPQKETVAEQPFLANLPAKEEEGYDYEGARANYFEALCESVEAFVIRGEIVSPSIALFPTSVIKTNDIKHYGWNIAQPFGFSRNLIADFLKVTFAHTMHNLEPTSISRKLTDSPNAGNIPILRSI